MTKENPRQFCEELIKSYRDNVAGLPTDKQIDGATSLPFLGKITNISRRFNPRVFFSTVDYEKIKGRDEELWEQFQGMLNGLQRRWLRTIGMLKSNGYVKEAVEIQNSQSSLRNDFNCQIRARPSNLRELKRMLKEDVEKFKEIATRDIAKLQALKRKY